MSLWIRDTSTIPDGGWRYQGLDGFVIITRNYSIFYDEVVKHYTANNATPPTREAVIQYLCQNVNVPCYDGPEPFANRWSEGLPSQFQSGGCCSK